MPSQNQSTSENKITENKNIQSTSTTNNNTTTSSSSRTIIKTYSNFKEISINKNISPETKKIIEKKIRLENLCNT